MLRTKPDVDRHVAKSFAKLKTAKERNFRGYSIGRLYFDVGDYDSCIRYVANYLNVKNDNAAAHTLLGQAFAKLGRKEEAVAEFKTSIELDPNQNNLLIKVCELLSDNSLDVDAGCVRYWVDRASAAFPHHPTLLRLYPQLLQMENADTSALISLLREQVSARPSDPPSHIRLLRQFLQYNRASEAFHHAFDVQVNNHAEFRNSLSWQQVLMEVIEAYRIEALSQSESLIWNYWFLYLTALDRKVHLQLGWKYSPTEATDALKQFDRILYDAAHCQKLHPSHDLLKHFSAQFCLHGGTLLLKRAMHDQSGWREMTRISAPLMLLAFQTDSPTLNKNVTTSWSSAAAYRKSQAGYTLLACAKTKKQLFLDQITQYCSGQNWREKIHKELFGIKDQLSKSSSYLLDSPTFVEPKLVLPNSIDMQEIDVLAQSFSPESLHFQTWLGLNRSKLSKMSTQIEGLPSSVDNLPNCGPETLSNLDIDAFLYCTVLIAQENLKNRKKDIFSSDRPSAVPCLIMEPLCSIEQSKWWEYARKFASHGAGSQCAEARLTLIHGIETIRCTANHGLDPYVLGSLGKLFAQRAETETERKKSLLKRAILYYSAALPMLERLKNHISVNPPKKRIFNFSYKENTQEYVNNMLEETKLFLGKSYMEDNDNDRAIEMLTNIKSPYASFYLYKIYMKTADEQLNLKKEGITSEMRIKNFTLLSKARSFIYITSDRLKDANLDTGHPLSDILNEHIENIESLLSNFDNDNNSSKHNVVEPESESDGHSSVLEQEHHIQSTPEKGTPYTLNLSRSLEAQIRQLQKKESLFGSVFQQISTVLESNKLLAEQVKEIKESLEEIKYQNINVADKKKFLSSVDDIQFKVTELRSENTSNVADLKKDISDLRKDFEKLKLQPSSQQRTEEEMYLLEEACRTNPYFPRMPVNGTGLPQHPLSMLYPQNFYPFYPGQYPAIPQVFPPQLLQPEQSIYSDLLLQGQIPIPQVTAAQPIVPPQSLPSRIVPPPAPLVSTSFTTPHVGQSQSSIPQTQVSAFQSSTVSKPSSFVSSLPTTAAYQNVIQPPAQPTQAVIHDYHINLPNNPPPQFLFASQTSTPSKTDSTPETAFKSFSLFDQKTVSKPNEIFESLYVSKDKTDLDVSKVLEKSHDTFDPCHDYKPMIPLPDEIVPTTGEENESILFDARAKLYRFIDREWKERGLGNIKILKNIDNGKVRILMRRDTVHTICANHLLLSEMELSTVKDVERTYFWVANDFADETLKMEKFCIKFKTVDISKNFYNVFNSCKNTHNDKVNDVEKTVNNTDNKNTWKCAGCSTLNENTKNVCNVCETSRPSSTTTTVGGFTFIKAPTIKPVADPIPQKPVTTVEATKPNPFASFTFAKPTTATSTVTTSKPIVTQSITTVADQKSTGWGDRFKPKPGSWSCKACYVSNDSSTDYCVACESPKEAGMPPKDKKAEPEVPKFTFGFNNVSTVATVAKETAPTSTFMFGMPNVTIEAVKKDIKVDSEDANLQEQSCTFGSVSNAKYDFVFKPKTAQSVKSPNKSHGEEDDDSYYDEDEGHHIMFEPIVPLPDKIKVKTGEEDEKIMYSHRAKLFRFAESEWKECGIGDIKILQNLTTKKFRVIMRREPILKICLNHALMPDVDYLEKDERTWLFTANDFSTGEICTLQFCVRFINKTVAGEFKAAIENAKNVINGTNDQMELPPPNIVESTKEDDDDDIQFVSETEVSEEDIKLAKKYMLPEKFYAYKQLPECSGCVGCIYEDRVKIFETPVVSKTPFATDDATANSVNTLILSNFNQHFNKSGSGDKPAETLYKSGGSIFNFSEFKFSQPTTQGSIFGGASAGAAPVFNSSVFKTNTTNVFDVTAKTTTPFAPPVVESKPLMFGNVTVKPTTNIFSSFTNIKPATTTPNIFSADNLKPSSFGSFNFSLKKEAVSTPEIKDIKAEEVNESREEEDDAHPEAEGEEIYFKPVVPLPDEIVVKTGEENEEVLYSHRAKVYRFAESEWKECGVGDVKILKHKITKSLRVLMRREPIMKICLNHNLTAEIEYLPKGDNSLLFQACDFSSGEVKPQQFCIRFSNKDIKTEFKEAVDKARSDTKNDSLTEDDNVENTPNSTFNADTTDEVEVEVEIKTDESETNTFPIVAKETSGNMIFGAKANLFPSFATIADNGPKLNNQPPAMTGGGLFGQSLFKNLTDSDGSTKDNYFGLAAQSSILANSNSNDSGKKTFTWAGAGAPIFGSKSGASKTENEEDKYDPHYEPIVPMPEEIVVVTGEEDEVEEFNEMGKLFRFTDGEWKERGFGSLKVLHHPERGSYRMLMRQNQVHKLVLNQLITKDLDLLPMKDSSKVYMWIALNYTDGEGVMESLAVRFKKENIAQNFYDKVMSLVQTLELKDESNIKNENEDDLNSSQYDI